MRSRRPPPPCTAPGCDRPAEARGLCHAHRAQAARGRPLAPLRPAHGRVGPEPLVTIGVRVGPDVLRALESAARDTGGTATGTARLVLALWARGQTHALDDTDWWVLREVADKIPAGPFGAQDSLVAYIRHKYAKNDAPEEQCQRMLEALDLA